MHKTLIGSGVAGLLLLGSAACGPEAGQSPSGNAAAAHAAEAGNEAAPAPKAAAAPKPAAAPIVLEGAGLGIPGASPPRTLGFDTPEAATIEALTQALGGPPIERGANEECGGGGLEYAAWKDRITIWFEDGRFAGWDNKGGLKTAGGIGLGSSRAEAALLTGFEVEESTLGTEFRAGGLSGILESDAPDAKVTHLWGGATCVFR